MACCASFGSISIELRNSLSEHNTANRYNSQCAALRTCWYVPAHGACFGGSAVAGRHASRRVFPIDPAGAPAELRRLPQSRQPQEPCRFPEIEVRSGDGIKARLVAECGRATPQHRQIGVKGIDTEFARLTCSSRKRSTWACLIRSTSCVSV